MARGRDTVDGGTQVGEDIQGNKEHKAFQTQQHETPFGPEGHGYLRSLISNQLIGPDVQSAQIIPLEGRKS